MPTHVKGRSPPDIRFKGQHVTETERSRIKKARKRQDYFRKARREELVQKVRETSDIVEDWDDYTPAGFGWWRTAFDTLTPPPQLTIDSWADRYRRIPPEFAAEPGDWQTKRMPCMRAVMQACSPSHLCRRVVLMKPTQSGGTEAAILNTIGHTIDINPRSMIVVFPNLDLAEAFSRERLEPMIQMVPRLSSKISDVSAQGIDRSSAKKKRYPGGFLNLVGANSTAGLSSRPVPMVIMDEVDACIQNAGVAGNPTKLLSARTTTFPDKKEIFISSPSNDVEETGIAQMWEDSSQGWLETCCPNAKCQHWQILEWEQMDLESATLCCTKCGQYFNQWQWNNRGEQMERWRFDNPNHNSTAGFRLSGLNSPWLDWQIDLVDEYKEAKRVQDMGDDSLMRVFVNTKLAKPYRVLGKRVEIDLYHDRREIYPCYESGSELPEGVVLLTAGVDVQDTYLAYDITGWGRARESWGIETGEFQGDPRTPTSGVWDQLDRFVFNRVLRYADGKAAKIRIIFVDSGGHCTTEVYQYCKRRQPRVFAIKGVGGVGKSIIIGGKTRERSEGAWLLRLGTDTLKDEFHARLAIAKPGPGFCHWPMLDNGEDTMGYNEGYFEQLVSEQRVLKYTKGGFARYEWHKNRTDANEALDMRCYARAALEYLKVRLEQIPKDIITHFNEQGIDRVEVGLGKTILVEKRQGRPVKKHANTANTIGGISNEEQPPARTDGTMAADVGKYGACTSSF